MNKDHINAKISEALSASLGNWEEDFNRQFWYINNDNLHEHHGEGCGCRRTLARDIKLFFAAEKEKRESEIKSALETIDWSDVVND